MYSENQMVTADALRCFAANCQLHMAKQAVFARFCTLFGADFHPKKSVVLGIRTWTYANKSTLCWQALHAEKTKTTLFASFFSCFS